VANILTVTEAATVLRCETTDPAMLDLLAQVDAYINNASGRDWTLDHPIRPEAKAAARILLVRAHEDPGAMVQPADALSWGLQAALMQLEAITIEKQE
jgi:hypothetical protein